MNNLFCIVFKGKIVRYRGKEVVGHFELVKKMLHLYRGGKCVRYTGQPAHEAR